MLSKNSGIFFSLFTQFRQFASTAQLVDGLRDAQTDAIEFVMSKTENQVRRAAQKYGLADDIVADVLHDGLVILIEKIRDGSYDVEKSAPPTYLAAICRNLLANHARLKSPPNHLPIESIQYLTDVSLVDLFDAKERCDVLENLLSQLGSPGADLIRMKYIDGFSDEEQINEHMTPYATVESLRVMRGRGMKSLVVLAEKWKLTHHAI